MLKNKRSIIILIMQLLEIGAVIGLGSIYGISKEYTAYTVILLFIINVVLWILFARGLKEGSKVEFTRVDALDEEKNAKLQDAKEKEDFFIMWTHQIKTPIAALNLLLQSENPDIRTCRQEVFHIENYVELALNYLRFEGMSSDLMLSSYNLENLVKGVVKKYASIFINKHLSVKLYDLDVTILTDDKWLSFVLEQLLSNALKYTNEGEVDIFAVTADSVELHIKDTGIGIKKEDLPRIFEKGFTGFNGRSDKKASGIGLYLVKGICDKLGHDITIESTVGQGTEVILTLKQNELKTLDLTKM